MDDRDIGPDGRHRGKSLTGERVVDEADVVVDLRQTRAQIALQDRKREPGRSGPIGVGHRRMGMFLDLQGMGPTIFDGIAETVQGTHSGVTAPGEDQLGGTASSDHLVVNEIGGHPDQGEPAAALAYHLVTRGERDQMSEPL
jgi:hypothetical protein